jgi:hypothetical protein
VKIYVVIEADTAFHSLFAYQVSRQTNGGDNYIYERPMLGEALVQAIDRGKFFGQLSVLLPTIDTVRSAAPIELLEEATDGR